MAVVTSILIGKRVHKEKTFKLKDCEAPSREGTDDPRSLSLRDTPPRKAVNDGRSPLTGDELLRRIEDLGDISKSELVRGCGYISITTDGSEYINFTEFYEALLDAKGISLASISESDADNDDSVEARVSSEEEPFLTDWSNLSNDQIIARIENSKEIDNDVLNNLLEINYWRIREAIAVHPRTPDVVLLRLLEDTDADVRSAVSRRDLPAPWCSMSKDRLLDNLRTKLAPESVLKQLSKSEDSFTRAAVASNPGISIGILETLQHDSFRDVRDTVGKQLVFLKLPEEWRLINDDERIERLNNGTVPVEVLEVLAISSNWEIRQAVARHEGTPDAFLNQLAEDEDSDVKQAIEDRRLPLGWRQLDEEERIAKLTEPVVPSEVLKVLSQSGRWRIRQAVANNRSVCEDVLERLRDDDDSDVASAARDGLLNLKLPQEWRLLDNDERIERLNVESIPVEVLELLATSSNWQIRQAVARSRSVGEDILDRLKDDDDPDVASAAREGLLNLKLPQEWRLLDDDEHIERLNNGTVPVEVLEVLAMSSNWEIRQAVARHVGTPDALLNQLAEDDHWYVREAIVDRRLPDEWRNLTSLQRRQRIESIAVEQNILEVLSTSPSSDVRRAVASTTRTPQKTLERLSNDSSYEVREAAKQALIQSKLPEDWKQLSETQKVKRLLSQRACTEVLQILALSKSSKIREAVARNSNSSINILLRMKDDSTTGKRINRLIRNTWGVCTQEAETNE